MRKLDFTGKCWSYHRFSPVSQSQNVLFCEVVERSRYVYKSGLFILLSRNYRVVGYEPRLLHLYMDFSSKRLMLLFHCQTFSMSNTAYFRMLIGEPAGSGDAITQQMASVYSNSHLIPVRSIKQLPTVGITSQSKSLMILSLVSKTIYGMYISTSTSIPVGDGDSLQKSHCSCYYLSFGNVGMLVGTQFFSITDSKTNWKPGLTFCYSSLLPNHITLLL